MLKGKAKMVQSRLKKAERMALCVKARRSERAMMPAEMETVLSMLLPCSLNGEP